MRFGKLFEPLEIGPYTLKNRIIRSPLGSTQALGTGEPSPQMLYRYGEEARGGAAMVIVEFTEVDSRYMKIPAIRADSDFYLAGLQDLAETIHLNGALACLQLRHPGVTGSNPVSPSGVPHIAPDGYSYLPSRAMTKEEIEEVVVLYSNAAYRAKLAGFDFVELHGGTSILLQHFVSPHYNRRTDEWGGSFEGRIRLPVEIVRQIRQECGHGFPVGYKIVVDEWLPDGITFEEAKVFAKRLEEEGVVYLRPQRGTVGTYHLGEGRFALRSPKASIVKYAELLKKEVSIPVFTNGQIHEPELMEEILKKDQADFVCLGRPLLADPEMPNKIKKDTLEDIRMCIRCNHCFDITSAGMRLTCVQNPASGRGKEYTVQPTRSAKRVLVVGGGPAGLEAASVAALRGHDVTLLEKQPELGGQVRIASLPIGKEHFMPYIIGWRVRQCQKAGVKIELGTEAAPEAIEKHNADVVIIATGAKPLIPQMPGVDNNNVVTAWDVLQGKAKLGRRLVVAGGSLVGIETADFIAEKGLAESVTILEMLPKVGIDMTFFNRAYLTQKLAEYGVRTITNHKVQEITDNGVVVINNTFNEENIQADTIVLALGAVSENGLAQALEGRVSELYTIGDCRKPRKLIDAILEGAYVARQI